uniref:DNA 5'-3' helicase n=1 Tax=Ophidocladus simpliciusculus TaxID=1261574 RepID=A0A1Z1MJ44_9FLOR|nr:Replication helicase subunit [Ophidocladus simpliciusculus]ARW66073.1 Replication helicase subunit [Ophidocladus simpliciusculus]
MKKLYKSKFIPQNYIAEEILIGIILIYPNLFSYMTRILKKEHFYLESTQIIYINLLDIYNYGQVNLVKLFYQLESNSLLYQIGGLKKITHMMKQSQIFIGSSNINNYTNTLIHLLNDNYIKRLIIQYGYNMIKLGYIYNIKNQYLYNKISYYLNFTESEILNNHNRESIIDIKNLISTKLLEIKYQKINSNNYIKNKIIRSGLIDLDRIIKNLPNNNLIILAGRPSIGKTSLAINIAHNIFTQQKINILILSLEMSSKEILNKLISIASKIEINNNITKKLNKQQWNNINKICKKLLNNNIYINDRHNIKIDYIENISQKLKKNNNIKLIIIDYLQLIEFSINEKNKYNRSQELGYITRKLKLLAQILKLPIIVLSQLNRNVEIRNEKEPLLSDLRESGCIDYKNHININHDLTNSINITNIKLIDIADKKNNLQKYIVRLISQYHHIVKKLYCFQEYTFSSSILKKQLCLTHNHSYLSDVKWIQCKQIILSTTINTIDNKINKNIYNKYLAIKKHYIHSLTINKYTKVYDIDKGKNFTILYKKTILHNSIEQDADIILMLYEKQGKIQPFKEKKILDIKIAKNRNGTTGLCEVLFTPQTTIFENINQNHI